MKKIVSFFDVSTIVSLSFAVYFSALILLMGSCHLWYDEAFSYLVAHLDLTHLLQATAADVHPPLHYLIVWAVSGPISSIKEFTIRFISILFSFFSFIILISLLDKKYPWGIHKTAKVIGVILYCLCPTQLYYGQEGRMYALFQLLVLLQIYGVLSRKWWLVGIATTLALYTHNYSWFFTAVIGLVALVYELTQTARNIDLNPNFYNQDDLRYKAPPAIQTNLAGLFLAFGIPFVLYLPWLFYATIPQIHFFQNGFHWILPVTFGSAVWTLFVSMIGTWYSNTVVLTTFLAVLGGLMMAIISAIKAKRYLILALAFGPWLLAVLASATVAPIMMPRALVPSTLFIFLLVGDALYRSSVRGRLIGSALLIPVVVIGLYGLASNAIGGTLHGNNFVDIPQSLQDGVMVVNLDDSTMITNLVYLPGRDQRMLDAGCPEEPGALRVNVRNAMGIKVIKLADLPEHYYFMASVGALSTLCHQQVYDQLAGQATKLTTFENAYGKNGFYEHILPR
jgi:hypothetical protein